MVRAWAYALGDSPQFPFCKGTTANSVVVGPTGTDAFLGLDESMQEFVKGTYATAQCLNRAGIAPAEDVADVVGMLCGKDSRWVTGSAVSACGGATMIL